VHNSIDVAREDTERIVQLVTLANPTLGPEKQAEEVYELLKDPTSLSAVHGFCTHSYWSRIWIIQEFAIGHSVDILLGDR
jgi:hypothetical protein